MIIAAAAILLNATLAHGIAPRPSIALPAAQGCHVRVVSHKFVGKPGTRFSYDGDGYTLPRSGSMELIATRADSYELAGRKLPLNVFPLDDFGTETIRLPQSVTSNEAAVNGE